MVTAGSFRAGGLFIFAKEMINIAIKLATSITYTADGSQTNFSVPFDYLRPSFVHVTVNDAEVSEEFTVSNRMVMFDSAPAKDAVVHIYRNTPTTRLVSWADASILKAIDMTIAEVQQLHILEEGQDWSKNNSIALDVASGAWQGRNHRMTDIADPQEPQDVMTLNAYNNHKDGLVTAVNAAATTAVKKCEEAVQTITSTSTSTIDNINNVKQETITTVTDNSNKATKTIKTLTDTTIANAESEANRAESEANRAQHLADKVDVSQYAMPVGFETFTTNPNLQAGWLPLLGGEYSRTAYADLWTWVQTQSGYLLEESAWQAKAAANGGNVPFYSKGDGSTTFRVPALKCWVKGAGNISEVGSYLEAQYPNTEHYHAIGYNTGSNSGRFIATNETQKYNLPYGGGSRNWNGSGGGGAFSTDTNSASQANMITSLSVGVEDSSGTVSPPSIVGLWCVKAYGTVTNVGSTDVANLAQGLANAETRISVLNTLVGAENNGGIVAYLLGKNGYIKFANGLIMQWGLNITSTTADKEIAYHIPFTTIPVVFTTNISNAQTSSAINVSDINLTTFCAHAFYGGKRVADNFNWLAIGV